MMIERKKSMKEYFLREYRLFIDEENYCEVLKQRRIVVEFPILVF